MGSRLKTLDKDSADHESRESLMQARVSALASLQTACMPAHRAHLEQAIAQLDERLTERPKTSAPPTAP